MLDGLRRLIRQRRNAKAFANLPAEQRQIVFYAEGPGDWVHFEPLIRHLWEDYGQPVAYLVSAETDPVLVQPPPSLRPFYIGDGTVRTLLFAGLDCDVMVMTMPDLHNYHIRRSPHDVHYAYIHHSIVSCHMIYREGAFDHFDSIFCVGPHHAEEIRAREAQAQTPAKTLVEHGYGRLEALMYELQESTPAATPQKDSAAHVLVAPSWGKDALLERHGIDFIEPLLEHGYTVTLRPHPQTAKLHPEIIKEAAARFQDRDGFSLDREIASTRSLLAADVMISDWSGAALEFAFALMRPVLFVDVPRKVNNPGYQKLDIEPLEVWIRERIGRVLAERQMDTMVEAVQELLARREEQGEEIAALRQAYIYNLGHSGEAGARSLMDIARGSA